MMTISHSRHATNIIATIFDGNVRKRSRRLRQEAND